MDYIKYLEKSFDSSYKKGFMITKKILENLGNPQDNLKIIHVAGTNGKGSVCTMLHSILTEQKYKVGIFTSPHLEKFNERIKINNDLISDNDFLYQIEKVKNATDKVLKDENDLLSFFELMTVIALNYFCEKNVDFVILETGIGGKKDVTNIIKSPILSIITSISLDHLDILGNNLLEIAEEKSGIIKKHSPVVLYSQTKEVYNGIEKVAQKRNSKLYYLDKGLKISDIKYNFESTIFSVCHELFKFDNINISLLGNYQIYNASLVLLSATALRDTGIKISDESIRNGLKKALWAGRMEIHKLNGKTILLEGAHNHSAMLDLKESLNIYFKNKNIVLILGVLADKEYDKIANVVSSMADKIIITRPNSPRSKNPKELIKLIDNKNKIIVDDYKKAIDEALCLQSDIICITGSLYLIGDSRKYIIEKENKNDKF